MKTLIILFSIAGLALSVFYAVLFFKELPRRVYFHLPMVAALLLYSYAGTLIAYVFGSETDLTRVLNRHTVENANVLYAMLLTALFAVAVHGIAMRMKLLVSVPTGYMVQLLRKDSLRTAPFFLIAFFVLTFYLYLIASGKLGYQGMIKNAAASNEDEASRVDPITSLVQPMIYVLPLMCGFRMFAPGRLWTTMPVLLAAMGCVLIQGRRLFQIFIFLCVLGIVLNTRVQASLFKRAGIIAGLCLLSVFSFFAFTAMRIASYSTQRADILTLATRAYAQLSQGNQTQDVVSVTGQNVTFRAFNPIVYLGMLTAADRSILGAGGEVLQQGTIAIVPSALWADKSDYLESEENIATSALHLNTVLKDEANTVLTSGYTDFREAGVLLHIVLFLVLIMACAALIKNAQTEVFCLILFSNTIWAMLSVEITATGRMTFLRDMCILFIIDRVVSVFSSQDTKKSMQRPKSSIHRDTSMNRAVAFHK
jgi:hypothetical protein